MVERVIVSSPQQVEVCVAGLADGTIDDTAPAIEAVVIAAKLIALPTVIDCFRASHIHNA